ncbi:A-kinase anchor protein inhibitor 1 [Amblyraja radiata]|uniref:A-kinase anchor protein inhibitor 1 n=1 Tax=Amblyraja radiata TaxID=386614 RepID=UPI001403AD14|nr:A-kinase anchor protein inhibitor 1 [Amblyraja radiata]
MLWVDKYVFTEDCNLSAGDKPENVLQEEELQITSKQIVEKAVLQAVQQYTQEKKQTEKTKAKKGSPLKSSGYAEQQEKKN